jgi:thiol:disulfide interchange protein DsbD
VFEAEVAPGWRLYAADSPVGRPFAVRLDPLPSGVTALALRQAPPLRAYDPGFESDYTYFAERARFVQPLRVGSRAQPGERRVSGALQYAVCNDEVCLPPARQTFAVPLVVE